MFVIRLEARSLDPVEAALRAAGGDASGFRVIDFGGEVVVLLSTAGDTGGLARALEEIPGVSRVCSVASEHVLASRCTTAQRSLVKVGESGGLCFGGEEIVVMAGPCAVESLERLRTVGTAVAAAGARMLRGGAFKPRTSPFTFQGLGTEGLAALESVREETGLRVVSECMSERELDRVDASVDMIQIGMRNAQNFDLLRAVGRLPSRRPVLLKCGTGMTLDELLQAADHILAGGNPNVVLCLRGHVDFRRTARATLSIADVAALRAQTHLPIVVDPSHSAGRWDLVAPTAAAAVVGGADGLLVEVHDEPAEALSDGEQALLPERFGGLMRLLRQLAPVVGRRVAGGPDAEPGLDHPFQALALEPPPVVSVRRGEEA